MWLALALSAAAQTCDPMALQKALAEAGPAASAKAYTDLAECDAAAGKAAAPEAFKKVLAGPGGDLAMVAAVRVGAGPIIRDWIVAQQPDDRSHAVSRLGQSCDQANVPAFFVDTATALGTKFWTERWYRGLSSCRDPGVQALLRGAIDTPPNDRTLLFGIIEAYSRNLGKDAIPALKELVLKEKDPEIATYIVNAFADAAGVGSQAGGDPEVAKAAVAAINEVAPQLPEKAVEQARTTVLTLGSEPDSDRLAAVRYKTLLQGDGGLLYGVTATEIATCKKGDVRIEVHTALIHEAGRTWPDQVTERITPAVNAIGMDLAASCKGTGTVAIVSSPAPLKDGTAFKTWVDAELKEVQRKNPGLKVKVTPEDPLQL